MTTVSATTATRMTTPTMATSMETPSWGADGPGNGGARA